MERLGIDIGSKPIKMAPVDGRVDELAKIEGFRAPADIPVESTVNPTDSPQRPGAPLTPRRSWVLAGNRTVAGGGR